MKVMYLVISLSLLGVTTYGQTMDMISVDTSKITLEDFTFLQKDVNSGHLVSSIFTGSTIHFYADEPFIGTVLLLGKVASYGLIGYGLTNIILAPKTITTITGKTGHGWPYDADLTLEESKSGRSDLVDLALVGAGIVLGVFTTAYDMHTVKTFSKKRKLKYFISITPKKTAHNRVYQIPLRSKLPFLIRSGYFW